jgi:PTH1 family peptidyl-tRNA hydrolase
MKLIVGLGNPGKEYDKTRHNVGFRMIDQITSNLNVEINKEKFDGKYGEKIIKDEKYLFLKPQRYMNLSGTVIKQFVDYFKININDILIICDDLDMEVGKIRLRAKGSSGGHNGLKDIEKYLGTSEYKRIKIGIANNKLMDTKDYVLGKFSKEENEIINNCEKILGNIFDDYTKISFDRLMSKYN